MGNCAGYCITEMNDDNKKKVTVEHQFNNPFEKEKAEGTLEIEYAVQNGGGSHKEMAVKGGKQDDEMSGGGPVTLPNGSVYTGQRVNGKKHGQGE